MEISVIIFDLLVLTILLISIGIATLRGFIREVLTIFGVVGGVAAAYFLGPLLAPTFNGWLVGDAEGDEIPKLLGIIPYDMVADFLAYGLIFIIVVIILSFVSHFLSSAAKALGLGILDRVLGALFGCVRAVIIIGIIYMPFYMLADKEYRTELFGNAKSYSYVERITAQLHSFMPESVTEEIEDDKKKGKDGIAEKLRREVEEKFQEVTGGDKDNKDSKTTDSKTAEPETTEDAPPPKPPANPSGYEDNQRERLEQLFEEGIDGMNEGNANE